MDVEACRKQWSEIAARISGYAIPSAASAESQIRRADESYQNQLGVVRDALAAYDYVSYDNSVAIGSEKYRRARKDTWQKFLRTVNEFRPFGSSTSHGSVFEVTLVVTVRADTPDDALLVGEQILLDSKGVYMLDTHVTVNEVGDY